MEKLPWELKYNLGMCTNHPTNRFSSGLLQMGSFPCWISFGKRAFPLPEREGAGGRGKHAWNVTSLFSCLFV